MTLRTRPARLRLGGSGDSQAGVTLVEMLVTTAIGSIVFAVAAQMVITGHEITRTTQTRAENTNQSGEVLDSAAKMLRAANRTCDRAFQPTCATTSAAVASGSTATSITFYSATGLSYNGSGVPSLPGPIKVRLTLSAGVLTEQVWNPQTFVIGTNPAACCEYLATPTRTRVLARNVTQTAQVGTTPGAPFSYYNGVGTDPLPLPLSATDALRVDHVQLDVNVAATTNPPISGSQFKYMVLLPNVQL